MSKEETADSAQGREYFNSLFSSALEVASLEDTSLNGTSEKQSSTASPVELHQVKSTRHDSMNYIPASDSKASTSSLVPKRTSQRAPLDDGQFDFEEAVERRLAATVGSKSSFSQLNDDTEDALSEEEMQRSSRSRQVDSRTSNLVSSRMPSTTSGTRTPVTDKNGLGWPAKGSLRRMNSTADQTAQTTAKLSMAVKTILECLGEDPEREGLKRTPERYAKALLWMTRGYEERLSGK
jgi:hypothetical protein